MYNIMDTMEDTGRHKKDTSEVSTEIMAALKKLGLSKFKGKKPVTTNEKSRKCFRCDTPGHMAPECQYKNKECNFCHKIGHVEKCCFKKKKAGGGKTGGGGNAGGGASDAATENEGKAPETMNSFQLRNEEFVLENTDHERVVNVYVDSMCTRSATGDESILVDVRPQMKTFQLAAGDEEVISTKVGSVRAFVADEDGVMHPFTWKEVNLVPNMHRTLIAGADFAAAGHELSLRGDGQPSLIVTNDGRRLPMHYEGRMWRLPLMLRDEINEITYVEKNCGRDTKVVGLHRVTEVPDSHVPVAYKDPVSGEQFTLTELEKTHAKVVYKINLLYSWHLRLGCLNFRDVVHMLDKVHGKKYFDGINLESLSCDACHVVKATRSSDGKVHEPRSTAPYQVTHSDYVVMSQMSTSGCQVAVFFVDDYTRDAKVYYALSASPKCLMMAFRAYMIESGGVDKFKDSLFQTDRGAYEFPDFTKYLEEVGIRLKMSPPFHQALNGVVERRIGVVCKQMLCMMKNSGIDKTYYDHALSYAVEVSNVISTRKHVSAYQRLHGKLPDLHMIKRFGCVAYILDNYKSKDKLEDKAIRGVFLGIARDSNYGTYIIGIPGEGKKLTIRHSRDVFFVEDRYYFKPVTGDITLWTEYEKKIIERQLEDLHDEDAVEVGSDDEESDSGVEVMNAFECTKLYREMGDRDSFLLSAVTNYDYAVIDSIMERKELMMNIEDKEKTRVPKNYEEAMSPENREAWKPAIDKEFMAMQDYGVFKEVKASELEETDVPVNIHTLFSEKGDGTKKVRVVLAGDKMEESEFDTYSPTSRIENMRLLLLIEARMRKLAASPDYKGLYKGKKIVRRGIDFRNAFINAIPRRRIVARPPRKYYKHFGKDYMEDVFWVLLKSLYGSPDAPREWYDLLSKFLMSLGYVKMDCDPCIFVLFQEGEPAVAINLHVDDLLIIGIEELVEELVSESKEKYKIKDLGDPEVMLGVSYDRDTYGDVHLHQERAIDTMIAYYGLHSARTTSLPHVANERLPHIDVCTPGLPYRSIVGSLLYTARATRPDISYNVMSLSRHLTKHDNRHFNAGKRVIRYLKKTLGARLPMKVKLDKPVLEIFCDADHSGDHMDPKKRSITGYVIYLFGGLYAAVSHVQKSVALSACDAEIMSASDAIKAGYSLAKLLVSMGIWKEEEMKILVNVDNQAAIKTLENVFGTSRTRHIDIRMAWIRDLVERGVVNLSYVESANNDADLLTKPLPGDAFYRHSRKMLVNMEFSNQYSYVR
jgi:hypothetical protein